MFWNTQGFQIPSVRPAGVRREYGDSLASLQAKHVRSCNSGRAWTPFRDALEGCTCPLGAVYYVVVRDGARADKIRVGRNRKDAERVLRKIAVSVDEGDYRP